MEAEEFHELKFSTQLSLVSYGLDVPLYIVAFLLISRIHSMQMAQYQKYQNGPHLSFYEA